KRNRYSHGARSPKGQHVVAGDAGEHVFAANRRRHRNSRGGGRRPAGREDAFWRSCYRSGESFGRGPDARAGFRPGGIFAGKTRRPCGPDGRVAARIVLRAPTLLDLAIRCAQRRVGTRSETTKTAVLQGIKRNFPWTQSDLPA